MIAKKLFFLKFFFIFSIWDRKNFEKFSLLRELQISPWPIAPSNFSPLWLRALKTLYFHFCNLKKEWKNKLKGFLQRILQDFMKKKIILGTSDTWLSSRLSHQPSEPAYYIVNWWMSSFQAIFWANTPSLQTKYLRNPKSTHSP